MKKNKLTLDTFKITEFKNKIVIVGGTGVGDDKTNGDTRPTILKTNNTNNQTVTW